MLAAGRMEIIMFKSNNVHKCSNGVVVVNTTPHPITIQDVDETLISIPNDPEYLLNASTEEVQVSDLFVQTKFLATDEGYAILQRIQEEFDDTESFRGCTLVVVGSILAAQAYPGKVAGLCPVPGYERVAPAEKRMRCDKFTIFPKQD